MSVIDPYTVGIQLAEVCCVVAWNCVRVYHTLIYYISTYVFTSNQNKDCVSDRAVGFRGTILF